MRQILMSGKNISVGNGEKSVEGFLRKVKSAPPVQRNSAQGRLLFAMDATASREPTWNLARDLQSAMFAQVDSIGGLDIQLVFFRGYSECKSSPWVSDANTLRRFMAAVDCEAGMTQIKRVLKHALEETRKTPVHAVVYVGDCIEESIDALGQLGGELRILNVPLFIFQEGYDPIASSGFAHLAKVSNGAHCRFDANSADQLGKLLNAAAVFASGGREALKQYSLKQDAQVRALLEQIK